MKLTQEIVFENNKLIVQFMELLKIEEINDLEYFVNKKMWRLLDKPKDVNEYFLELFCHPKNSGHYKFYSSWNLLMPVVDKIEELGYDTKIERNNDDDCHYTEIFNMPNANDCICPDGNSKIETTYNAVIEFITWYNKNK